MTDISKKVGISKKTLYQVFASKDVLIEKFILKHLEKDRIQLRAIKENSLNAIEELVLGIQYGGSSLQEISPITIHDLKKYYLSRWDLIQNLYMVFLEKLIEENYFWGLRNGLYRKVSSYRILSKLFCIGYLSMSSEDIFPAKEFDRSEMVAIHIECYLRGIVSESGHVEFKRLMKS